MDRIKLSEIIKNKSMIIHTTKEEQAKALCKRLDELGRKWSNGNSYLEDTNWSVLQEKTCYSPNSNGFGNVNWFANSCIQVIEFADIDLEK